MMINYESSLLGYDPDNFKLNNDKYKISHGGFIHDLYDIRLAESKLLYRVELRFNINGFIPLLKKGYTIYSENSLGKIIRILDYTITDGVLIGSYVVEIFNKAAPLSGTNFKIIDFHSKLHFDIFTTNISEYVEVKDWILPTTDDHDVKVKLIRSTSHPDISNIFFDTTYKNDNYYIIKVMMSTSEYKTIKLLFDPTIVNSIIINLNLQSGDPIIRITQLNNTRYNNIYLNDIQNQDVLVTSISYIIL